MAQTDKAAPDWERIEADYRAGVLLLGATFWGYGHYQYKQGYTERNTKAALEQAVATSSAQASARAKEKENAKLDTVPGTCRVPGSPGTASVDHGATRADIDPRDAGDIIAILARGDEAIRQLNVLQDWAGGVTH